MWGIAYRVAYPGLGAAGLSLLFILLLRHSAKKIRDEKRKRTARYELFLFSLLGILGLGLSLYYSLDLIVRDFSVREGTLKAVNNPENTIVQTVFSENGEAFSLGAIREDAAMLKNGESYSVTFGKRTGMLVKAEVHAD